MDIVIILLVAVLLLFGLVALLNVLSDPFDGTEVGLEGFLSRLNLEYFNRQLVSILLSLVVAVPIAFLDYDKYKPFVKMAYLVICALLTLLLVVKVNTRVQHHPHVALIELLFLVGVAHHRQEGALHA